MIKTSASPEIGQELAKLFISAATAATRRFRHLGIDSTVEKNQPVVTREATHTSSSTGIDYVLTTANALADSKTARKGAPWLTEIETGQLNKCAELLGTSFAENLPFDAPPGAHAWPLTRAVAWPGNFDAPAGMQTWALTHSSFDNHIPDYERDPHDWISRMLIQPALLYHLQQVEDVASPGKYAPYAFATEVIAVANANDLKFLSVVPLIGIEFEQTADNCYTADSVRIRRLSDHEQAKWWIDHQERRLWPVGVMFQPPEMLLEISSSGPRDSAFLPPRHRASALVGAFYIHGYPIAGTVVAETADPPWLLNGIRHSGPLLIPHQRTGTAVLTSANFQSVANTAKLLSNYNLQQPHSTKDLTIHRFLTGIARESDADAVIDFTIVLESLLLPLDRHTRHGDLSYRFRTHGAHYIANAARERTAIFDQLREIYDMRSRLVHGGKYPKPEQIGATRQGAYELARRGLLRALHGGFPTVEGFQQMLLGEQESYPSRHTPT